MGPQRLSLRGSPFVPRSGREDIVLRTSCLLLSKGESNEIINVLWGFVSLTDSRAIW